MAAVLTDDVLLSFCSAEEIVCECREGSVTFYRPLLIHSSMPPVDSGGGGRRRVLAHRMRAADLSIPGWDWPSDWVGVTEPVRASQRWVGAAPKL